MPGLHVTLSDCNRQGKEKKRRSKEKRGKDKKRDSRPESLSLIASSSISVSVSIMCSSVAASFTIVGKITMSAGVTSTGPSASRNCLKQVFRKWKGDEKRVYNSAYLCAFSTS